jgi:anti-anti-sigma regulatory factor
LLHVQRSGNSWQLAGSLDAEGGRALLRAIGERPADVRIDGSQLRRIDGAGLTALAVARQQCRADGHTFAVTEVAPDALQDLRVGVRLLDLFASPGTHAAVDARGDGGGPSDGGPARGTHRTFHFQLRRRHDGTER